MESIVNELLVKEFSTEEQRMFLDNFRCYLQYDSATDFVIDFDKAYRWAGFTQKANAKRLLLKHFDESTHFLLLSDEVDGLEQIVEGNIRGRRGSHNLFIPKDEKPLALTEMEGSTKTLRHVGRPRESIMLTPDAFKDFCMRADTQKAKDVRTYYIKMERVVFQSMETVLQKTHADLVYATDKIQALENDLKKYRAREKRLYDVGDTVYVIRERGVKDLFKIGCTDNMNAREKQYFTHSNQCVVVYTRACKDRRFLEKAVHNRFVSYRYKNRSEWFQAPFELIRKGIEDIQIVLEGELSPVFTFDASALEEDPDDLLATPNQDMESPDGPDEEVVAFEKAQSDTEEEEEEQQDKEEDDTYRLDVDTFRPDYDRFLDECFDVVEGHKTSWVEIRARFRLWSRTTVYNKDALAKYLVDSGFKKTFLFDEKYQTNVRAHLGLRMHAVPGFVLTHVSTEVERFLFDACRVCVTGRISIKDLYAAYDEWKKAADADYKGSTNADHRVIKDRCCKDLRFLASIVHDGTRNRFGFYGFCLKGNERIGTKPKPGNRKRIEQVDPATSAVVREFASMTQAAKAIGATPAALSSAIAAQKFCKGFLFRKSVQE